MVAGHLGDGAAIVPHGASVKSVKAFGGNDFVHSKRGQVIPVHFHPHRMMSPQEMADTLKKTNVHARYFIGMSICVDTPVFALAAHKGVYTQLRF